MGYITLSVTPTPAVPSSAGRKSRHQHLPGGLVSICNIYSGSTEVTTHLGHMSHCKQHLVQNGRIDGQIKYSACILAGIESTNVVHLRALRAGRVFRTVDYGPFIKSQLATRNPHEGLVLGKSGHVTPHNLGAAKPA